MNKIVIFLNSLGTGGAERVCISYANWLVNNTNDMVYLLTFNDSKNIYDIDAKVNMVALKINSKNKFCRIYSRLKKLKTTLREIKPDIYFTVMFDNLIYSFLSKPKNCTFISSERNNIKIRPLYYKLIFKFIAKKCDGFIFQTKNAKLDYPKKLWNKSIVIPNAVSKTYSATDHYKKKNVISAMGRLAYQKGFDTLIRAFSIFNKKNPDYELDIFGDGPDISKLTDLCQELNIKEKVVFHGIKSNSLKYVSESKLFVLSSRFEGMPNALLEAMSVGTACISTDCDYGPSEIIVDNVNGILVKVDDVDMLAKKMIYLIEHDKVRAKIEHNSLEVLKNYNLNVIYKKYYDYFNYVNSSKNK